MVLSEIMALGEFNLRFRNVPEKPRWNTELLQILTWINFYQKNGALKFLCTLPTTVKTLL